MPTCLTCGKVLVDLGGKIPKKYCNSTCRSKGWYKENVAVKKDVPPKKKKASKKKEVEELITHFTPTTKESYDGEKLKNITYDEPAMWATPKEEKQIPPTMPVRMPGEDALTFGMRKSEWKKKYA